ncbi:MAG: lytic transglycosylase domain-containing protein [Firmicutes bacterium]|nr:lytic transglycosylase domain-containing protein [Bacillota bacterium]
MSKLFKFFLALLAAALAVAAVIGGYSVGKRATYPVAYSEYIIKYADEYELDIFLVMGVIKQESNFVPDAESDYACGLMQLTEETAAWNAEQMGLNDYDYKDPETNIRIGCHYLRYLIDHYQNTDTALAAYNAGMGNVSEWLANPDYSSDGVTLDEIPFSETRHYVKKVNGYCEKYREQYG